MSNFIGQLVSLGVGRETTRGTPVAATYWLPHTTFNFDDKAEKFVTQQALGVIDEGDSAFVTKKWGEGSVEGFIRDKSFGLLLYALTGAISEGGGGGPSYTHTFTIAQSNQHTSLTFAIDEPNQDWRFALVMLSKLSLDVTLGQPVKFQADFMSRQGVGTTQTKSYVAENHFVATHANIKLASLTTGLAAASVLPIKNLKIEFNKNLYGEQDLGTASLANIHNQTFSVEGEFELHYDDQTYRNYMLDGTYRALRIDLINTDVDLGSGVRPELLIDLSRVHFFEWEQDRSIDKIVTQKVKFKALYDLANAKQIVDQIVLTNAVASY